MSAGPLLRLLVELIEVGVELSPIDPPDPPPTDLYRRQFARSNERIDLRNTHAQVGRDVFQGHEARLDGRGTGLSALGRTLFRGHDGKIALYGVGFMDLVLFAPVCSGRAA